VSDALLCQVDMPATFAELLQVKIPAKAAPDSENHLSAWLNRGGKGREYLVLQNVQNNLSIEDGKWKYIAPGPGPANNKDTNTELGNLNKDQLYNLTVDRGERNNVAEQNPKITAELKVRLEKVKAVKQ
jgi:arylsulfatase A-like enzyme